MKEWISHDFEHSFDVFGWLMIGEESLEKGWSKKEWLGGREDKKFEQKFASNFSSNFWNKWKWTREQKAGPKVCLKLLCKLLGKKLEQKLASNFLANFWAKAGAKVSP